ncbi:hypothetical protein L3N51_01502 [Metallosphaera sp. J1]|nr:hypothetical protein [Metallosphaera javensis (ex Hofmann et al. 2022)]
MKGSLRPGSSTLTESFYFWGRSILLGQKLLFDERPKTERRDLFDRERELEELVNNLHRPLVVVTGVRRIGKTSTLMVALRESGLPFLVVDARKLRDNYSLGDLYALLSQALSSSLDRLKDVLSRVQGVGIMGNYVELSWKGKRYVSLGDLFDHLNEKRIIIAVDEAQRLRGPHSGEIKNAMAHAYDYDRNLTFVLTGSEVGLLHEFLGTEDEGSPLYSRYYHEVRLERFSREQSFQFLERGFSEAGMKVEESVIEEMVEFFDGIPGWLTVAGNHYLSRRDLGEVKEMSVRLALNELRNLIESKARISEVTGRRYREVLKCVGEGANSWSKLERCVSEREGVALSSSVLSNVISQLEGMSVISGYQFLDPVYREAVKRL